MLINEPYNLHHRRKKAHTHKSMFMISFCFSIHISFHFERCWKRFFSCFLHVLACDLPHSEHETREMAHSINCCCVFFASFFFYFFHWGGIAWGIVFACQCYIHQFTIFIVPIIDYVSYPQIVLHKLCKEKGADVCSLSIHWFTWVSIGVRVSVLFFCCCSIFFCIVLFSTVFHIFCWFIVFAFPLSLFLLACLSVGSL